MTDLSAKKLLKYEKKLKKKQAELNLRSAEIPMASSSKFSVAGVIESLRDASSKVKKLREDSSQQYPKVCLTTDKMKGRPIVIPDILQFQLYSLLHSESGLGKPKFCHLKPSRAVSQVILIIVEIKDFPSETLQLQGLVEDHFTFARRFFRDRVLVKCSNLCELRLGLFRVPVSPLQVLKEKLSGSPTAAPRKNAKTTDFLLSVSEMIQNNYPLPIASSSFNEGDEEYLLSKPEGYRTVKDSSPVFAIDCEMCLTGKEGKHELTRVSVVDEELRVIFDTLVQPERPITNYLTKFSGITEKLLRGVTTTLQDVQRALAKLLPPDAILLGHSLNFDLHALRLYHPYVLDLSIIYNLSGVRQLKSSLQTLSATFLNSSIQDSSKGHCSIEDSWATMRLFKKKLLSGLDYGNVQLGWSYIDFAAQKGQNHTGSKISEKEHDDVSKDEGASNAALKCEKKSEERGKKRRHEAEEDAEVKGKYSKVVEESEIKQNWEEITKPRKFQKKGAVGQGVPFSPTLHPGLFKEPEKGSSNGLPEWEPVASTSQETAVAVYNGNCDNCTATLDHRSCRNSQCLCRSLKWSFCSGCISTNHNEGATKSQSEPILNKTLDFSEAVGLGDIYSLGSRDFDTLGEYLKNRRKKACVFGTPDFTALADTMGKFSQHRGHLIESVPSEDPDLIVEQFKLRLLEYDLAIVQFTATSEAASLAKVDEAISKLHVSAPKKALISMLVTPVLKDGSLSQNETLCCVRIKT